MGTDRMGVLELLRKAGADGDVDFLREGVRVLAQAVMEAEVTELTGCPTGNATRSAGSRAATATASDAGTPASGRAAEGPPQSPRIGIRPGAVAIAVDRVHVFAVPGYEAAPAQS